MLNDTFHSYTWNVYDRPATIDSITRTYDAFDRLVEQNISGTNYETVYTPSGGKLGVWNGSTIQQAYVPLPGGAQAEYASWGLSNYRHADWLGSDRMETDTTAHVIDNNAYAPFGEPYAQTGNGEISFTGQNKDTDWLQYDFLFRQYDPKQGRWISPDPAGTAAVNPADPQSWNRYAYANNRPTNSVDPLGLFLPAPCDGFIDFCMPSCPPEDFECLCPIDQFCDLGGDGGLGGGGGDGGGGRGPHPTPTSSGYHPVSNWPRGETLGLPGGLNVHPLWSIGNLFGLLPNAGCGDFGAICNPWILYADAANNGSAGNISVPELPYTIDVLVLESAGHPSRHIQEQPDPHTRKYADYVSCVIAGWADSKLKAFLTADLFAYKASTPLAKTGTRMISGGRFSPGVQATADVAFYVFVGATAFYATESASAIRSSCTEEVYGR